MKSRFKRQLLPWRVWLLIGFCVLLAIVFGSGPALRAYRLGQARRALLDYQLDRALDRLEAAARGSPDSPEIQFLLARTHRKLGNLDTARKHLKRAWELGYPKAAVEREQWMAMAQSGRLNEAEPKLKAHLAQSGEDVQEICEALVNGYLRNYNFVAARNWLDAWQADFPTAAQPHYCRGLIWQHIMSYEKADDELGKALELAPHRSDVRLELARTLAMQQKFEAAARHYRICSEQCPDDPQALSGLAQCLVQLGENDQALALYQQMDQRWPDDVDGQLGLAKLELDAGRPETALRRLRPLVQEHSHYKELRYVLATALRSAGESEEAKVHFEYVRKANDASARVRRLMEDVRAHPELVEPRYEIGSTLLEYGSPAEGAAWLRSVLELDPNHRPTHRTLAEYYAQQKNGRLAEQHRRLAGEAAN